MVRGLAEKTVKTVKFLRYRFRYISNYIMMGFLSILFEILIIKYVLFFDMLFFVKVVIGFIFGTLLSFFLNAKLNFKVPKSRNKRTFIVFVSIAVFAFTLNLILIKIITNQINIGYNYSRFLTAAIIFMLSYTLHRKITFDFVKKVGIAVYLNKKEEVSKIYSKIRYYADFIHIDLIDKSFDKGASEIDLPLLQKIRHTWGAKKVLHIMSKTPSVWIKKLYKDVDVIIFHLEIDESVESIIKLCKKYKKKVGITLMSDSKIESILQYLPQIDFVQVMGINELGKSGQLFNPDSLDKVNTLNKLKRKYKFEITFDGGVKPTNIRRINAKYIVSASGILSSEDPVKAFMELKTSARYHPVEKQLREDLIKGIKNVVESSDFIVSGNIVGSFAEGKGLEGINDIDIVIITKKLTKKNFQTTLKKFEDLKNKIESNYGYKIIINPTLGPLKFNRDNIVFHLMVYDIESHKLHCEKSPFTCLDWQRSPIFFKKSMSEIYKVRSLYPLNFLDSRRGAKEYLSEIKSNKLSYREYKFSNNKVIEEKKYKEMGERDRIEFSYHIVRFLISNFIKLYSKKNKMYSFNEMLIIYFNIFPKNKKIHKSLLKKIYSLRKTKNFVEPPRLLKQIEYFIEDFNIQFKKYFYDDSREIIFLRHAETKSNKKKYFIGQKLNPDIIKPKNKILKEIRESVKDVEIVYSSPMKRCTNTLNLITDKKILFDSRLIEMDYGEAEGMKFSEISSKYPYLIEKWNKEKDPNFPKGENTRDVFIRVMNFIANIKKQKNKKTLVCTHNVVLRTILGSYFKIPLKYWFKIEIPHNNPIRLIITKNNRVYLELSLEQNKNLWKNF